MVSQSIWHRSIVLAIVLGFGSRKQRLVRSEIDADLRELRRERARRLTLRDHASTNISRMTGYSAMGLGLVVGLGALPTHALAGDGWYLGGSLGESNLKSQDWQVDFENNSAARQDGPLARVDWLRGFAGSLQGGYAFSNGLRLELEGQYRSNEVSSIDLAPMGSNNGGRTVREDGDQKGEILFANVWYDLFKNRSWHPYIGGGAGYAKISLDGANYDGTKLRDDDDTVFAYQLGAGIGFDISPNVTFSVDYRYVKTDDLRYDLLDSNQPSTIKSKYEADAVFLGVRYSFGKPASEEVMPPVEQTEQPVQVVDPVDPALEESAAPAADATPAAVAASGCEAPGPGDLIGPDGCKASNTMVLRGVTFEHNKAVLTPDSKTILDGVADQLKTAGDVRISVIGHTDSQGNDDLNRTLSESRAKSVRAYLVERGVDGAHMTALGMGASQPVSDNNTEEGRQQNRRVELKVIGASAPTAPAAAPEPIAAEAVPADAPAPEATEASFESAPAAETPAEPVSEAPVTETPAEPAPEAAGPEALAPEVPASEAPAEQTAAEPAAEAPATDAPTAEPAAAEGAAPAEGTSGGMW